MRRKIELATDQGGLALIEFAFALPVLLTLVLAGLETANLALANLRLNQMAMMVADNAARVRDSISEQDVNSLLYGAKTTGAGMKFGANGRIVLSDVELNAAGNGQWIRWQRCSGALAKSSAHGGEGTGKANASLPYVGTPTNRLTATASNPIMFVEVFYQYQPLVWNSLYKDQVLTWRAGFNVRQRTDQAVKPVTGVTASSCLTYAA